MRKAVRLTNGQQALPIRIEFLLTKRELIDALCWTVKDEEDSDEWPTLSARQVVQQVRTALRENGDTLSLWFEGERRDRIEAVEAWAKPLIERAFGSAFDPHPLNTGS